MFKSNQENIVQFTLPYQPYAFKDTERAIEIPWGLSCLRSDEVVLDVGYAYAEPRYINEITNLPLKDLYGYDIVVNEGISPKIKKYQGDLRKIECFSDSFFDSILCISTIEHVGFNNDVYFKEDKFIKSYDDDLIAIVELTKILKSHGKLIITVPFGKRVDYEWFIQYDSNRLHRLINRSSCYVHQLDFFIYENHGWSLCKEIDLADIEYKSNEAPAAAGLACLLLKKK
ncbi:MAG: hypothetical protein ACHQQQ_00010 [Bacteroidota bacterium]